MRARHILTVAIAVSLVACSNLASPKTKIEFARAHPQVIQSGQSPTDWVSFLIPSSSSIPQGIVVGPDGNIWFVESGLDKIARITMKGIVTEFAVQSAVEFMAVGPDHAFYAVGQDSPNIVRMTKNGQSTLYPISSGALDIALGRDGNMWFTESDRVGRLTISTGKVTEYPLPDGNVMANGITMGPDGNMWFDEREGSNIGEISVSDGTITEFPVGSFSGSGITTGKDGNLWLTTDGGGTIYKVTPTGTVTGYPMGQPGTPWPNTIQNGPDGTLWFVDEFDGTLGRMTVKGNYTAIPSGDNNGGKYGLIWGPDGNLWTTDPRDNTIEVYVQHVLTVVPSSLSLPLGQDQGLVVFETHYHKSWTAKTSDPTVATVALMSQDVFDVKAVGIGSCTIVVSDRMKNSFPVAVVVY
jgi:streptogramin lyase